MPPIEIKNNAYGSIIDLEPAYWLVCFVPPIAPQWWHPLVHRRFKHCFAMKEEPNGYWTLFEPWWTRILLATITAEQATKFLTWAGRGETLLVRAAVPGVSNQLRIMMTCGALMAHMLGRKEYVWTPFQLYKRLLDDPTVERVNTADILARLLRA